MAGRGRGRKRKVTEDAEKQVENESVSEPTETKKEEDEVERIQINRAPVLTLWVAVVAEREGYSYEEGLSFGKAIAGMLAHSKGRRLGVYEDKDLQDRKRKMKQQQKEKQKFDVFGMKIAGQTTKEGTRLALQNNKPISPASVESYLRKAFGPYYDQAKVSDPLLYDGTANGKDIAQARETKMLLITLICKCFAWICTELV